MRDHPAFYRRIVQAEREGQGERTAFGRLHPIRVVVEFLFAAHGDFPFSGALAVYPDCEFPGQGFSAHPVYQSTFLCGWRSCTVKSSPRMLKRSTRRLKVSAPGSASICDTRFWVTANFVASAPWVSPSARLLDLMMWASCVELVSRCTKLCISKIDKGNLTVLLIFVKYQYY